MAQLLKNDALDRQMQELVEIARQRYELVRQSFEGGEISVETLIDAGLELDRVELRAANNPAARREVKERARSSGSSDWIKSWTSV